jgi:hypothetical protein
MKTLLIGLVLGMALFVMPAAATAAEPLIPCGGANQHPCQSCDVVTLANNVVGWLVGALGAIAVLIIVYAGIKMVTSNGNHHALEEAKGMMMNMIIGYLIVLAAWLVLDYVLKALLIDGNWNTIQCVEQPKISQVVAWSNPGNYLYATDGWTQTSGGTPGQGGSSMQAKCATVSTPSGTKYNCTAQMDACTKGKGVAIVSPAGDTVVCTGQTYTVSGGGGVQCADGNSACSVSSLMQHGMTSSQANVMSCIAMAESSGRPSARSNTSTACGTFQVIKGTWAGAATGACKDFSMCIDANCNIQTVVTLVRQSGYSSWTCVTPDGTKCDAAAPGCVAKYSGS